MPAPESPQSNTPYPFKPMHAGVEAGCSGGSYNRVCGGFKDMVSKIERIVGCAFRYPAEGEAAIKIAVHEVVLICDM